MRRTLNTTAVLLVLFAAQAMAQPQQGGGRVDAVEWVANNASEVTIDTVFAQVPDMELTFRSRYGGPLVVHFCAETTVDPLQRLRIQGVVDGASLVPSEITMDEDEQDVATGRASHCVVFAGEVGPGWHTAEVQWRSDLGGQVFIDERTMVVQYLK